MLETNIANQLLNLRREYVYSLVSSSNPLSLPHELILDYP